MKYLFDDEHKVQDLRRVLSEWSGTPYRHRCCVKRKGCDCIHFVAGVLDDLGIYKYIKRKMPQYPKDWHLHNTYQFLYEEIKRQLNVIDVYDKLYINGDILLFTFGHAASHSSIYCDGYVHQAFNGVGVTKVPIHNKDMMRILTFHLRLVE